MTQEIAVDDSSSRGHPLGRIGQKKGDGPADGRQLPVAWRRGDGENRLTELCGKTGLALRRQRETRRHGVGAHATFAVIARDVAGEAVTPAFVAA